MHTLLRVKLYLHHQFRHEPKRLNHIYEVKEMAERLGVIHGADTEKLRLAALLHDITKNDTEPKMKRVLRNHFSDIDLKDVPSGCLHAYTASILAENHFNIHDLDILNAITYHCSGRKNMSLIEQIIFLSDFLEETRTFVSNDLREIAKVDLNKATYLVFDSTIKYLKKNKSFVSPLSLEAFDYYHKNTGGNG